MLPTTSHYTSAAAGAGLRRISDAQVRCGHLRDPSKWSEVENLALGVIELLHCADQTHVAIKQKTTVEWTVGGITMANASYVRHQSEKNADGSPGVSVTAVRVRDRQG